MVPTSLKGCDEYKRDSGWPLSTVPGAEPRFTDGRCTQGFLGVLSHLCGMHMSVSDTHRQAWALRMYLGINSVMGETTSAPPLGFIREGLMER